MIERTEVLTPTESRQASPRRLNFRVLVGSMILALVAAGVLYYTVFAVPSGPISLERPAVESPPKPAQ